MLAKSISRVSKTNRKLHRTRMPVVDGGTSFSLKCDGGSDCHLEVLSSSGKGDFSIWTLHNSPLEMGV